MSEQVRRFPISAGPRKIADAPKPCFDPQHMPPCHQLLDPGEYEHVCPGCGFKKRFIVRGVYV